MAIASLNGFSQKTNIYFMSRLNKNYSGSVEKSDIRSDKSLGLRKVPVIVLIAMSPLTSSDVNASFPILPEANIENTSGSTRSYSKELSRETIRSGYQECTFIKYDKDFNNDNAERLGFRYSYLSEGGFRGLLGGVFTSICCEKNPNKTYTATFYELKGNQKSSEVQLVNLPEAFGKYLLRFAKSNKNNNAIQFLPKASYVRVFGSDTLKEVPMIEDAIGMTMSVNGEKILQERSDGYWETR